jgi:Ca-activated chloride channel family protein
MLARPAKDAAPLPAPMFTVTALSDGEAKTSAAPLWVGREAQPEIVLPAGEYRVRAEHGLARQEQAVKIAAATGTTFDAMLATGRLELSATRGTGADPGEALTGGVLFIVHEDDPDSTGGRREVTRSAAPSPTFTLPAGTYYVTARTAGAEAREQIAIGAGGVVRRALPLALSRLTLSATLDGKPLPDGTPIVYSVFRLDGEPRQVVRTVTKEPELDLSAGRYRVEAVVGATNVKSAVEVSLASGQPQKAVMKLEAGHATLTLAGGRAPTDGDVFWEVEDGQRTVLRTSQPEPTALLAPGRYIITAQTRDRQVHGAIDVKAGETRTFEIGGL